MWFRIICVVFKIFICFCFDRKCAQEKICNEMGLHEVGRRRRHVAKKTPERNENTPLVERMRSLVDLWRWNPEWTKCQWKKSILTHCQRYAEVCTEFYGSWTRAYQLPSKRAVTVCRIALDCARAHANQSKCEMKKEKTQRQTTITNYMI